MPNPSAINTADFLNSIGVNAHLDVHTGAYANTSLAEADLNYLGVGNVRDSIGAQSDATLFANVAAATGVKFDFVLVQNSLSFTYQMTTIAASLGIVSYVEGVNESDDAPAGYSYEGLTGFAATAAIQQALYSMITSNPLANGISVIGPSYGQRSSFALAPNTSATSNFGNIHDYIGNGNGPSAALASYIANAELVSGGLPIIASEAGYYTGPTWTGQPGNQAQFGVDDTVQAKYDLTLLFDNWAAGISNTYLYELMDEAADPNNTTVADHYGLFNADGTPKLAATTIHNLTSILKSAGADTQPGTLGYQITGLPSTGNSLLMEGSGGTYDLALWNNVKLWNSTTQTEIASAPTPITINFGQIMQSVSEYDPLTGVTSVAGWSNTQTVTLGLLDHPVILEVTPYQAGALSLSNYVSTLAVASNRTTGQSTGNLWSQLIGNAIESNPNWLPGMTISAVGTAGTAGSVLFNAATQTLTYTTPAYNPLNPNDSFTYTLADTHGNVVTGTVAISEIAPAATTYDLVAGTAITAPSNAWTLVSSSSSQTLTSAAQGGDRLLLGANTVANAFGNSNVITGAAGNHTVEGSGNTNTVTLGDGNNTLYLYGTGDVVTTGNGNNVVWKTTGSTSIATGNGNQTITVEGANNVISTGVGTSMITAGTDGNAAGHEYVTVAGGTNSIYVGGSRDNVTALAGNNNIHSADGLANIVVDAGTNLVNIAGDGNHVTALAGVNTINMSGNANLITGGSGSDAIWLAGTGNVVNAGRGTDTVNMGSGGNTFVSGTGQLIVDAYTANNTFVLGAPGAAPVSIYGNTTSSGDTFDLRTALAATNWDGYASDLSSYLRVSSSGTASAIAIDADGSGSGQAVTVATLNNTPALTYQGLLANAILPAFNTPPLALKQNVLSESLSGTQQTGNLWSVLVANATTSTTGSASAVEVTAIQTSGTTGTTNFNPASDTLIYTAPAYNPFNPNDKFTYTLSDGNGHSVTGTVSINEIAPAATLYDTVANGSITETASAWTLVSSNTGQTLNGSVLGGDTFLLNTDTSANTAGNGNSVSGATGNHIVKGYGNNNQVTLGDGNNTFYLYGTGNVVTTGNGNNVVWKPIGSTSFTAGNGNQTVTVEGTNNSISIGSGVSSINAGTDGTAAGQEKVVVAGGSNTINVGGANDSVLAQAGNNNIHSAAGLASIEVNSGTNLINAGGNSNIITALAGSNTINATGNTNLITGGSGTDTIWVGGTGNVINAGAGNDYVSLGTGSNTVAVGIGQLTLSAYSMNNTIILSGSGGPAPVIHGNTISCNDTFDLRAALADTTWDGHLGDLANYLSVSNSGTGSVISIDPDGTSGATWHGIGLLSDTPNLTFASLLSHAIT